MLTLTKNDIRNSFLTVSNPEAASLAREQPSANEVEFAVDVALLGLQIPSSVFAWIPNLLPDLIQLIGLLSLSTKLLSIPSKPYKP